MSRLVGELTDSWRDGQEIDVVAEMTTLTVKVAAATLFSVDFRYDDARRAFQAMTTVTTGVVRRAISPRWVRALPLPANRRFDRAAAHLRLVLVDLSIGIGATALTTTTCCRS